MAISKGYETKIGSSQVVGITELVTRFFRLAKSGPIRGAQPCAKRTNGTLKRHTIFKPGTKRSNAAERAAGPPLCYACMHADGARFVHTKMHNKLFRCFSLADKE